MKKYEQSLKPALANEIPRQHPMAVFTINEIKSEISKIKRATGITGNPISELQEDEWDNFITNFTDQLGPVANEIDSSLSNLSSLYQPDLAMLHQQCCRVLKALNYASNLHGTDYSSTETVLLPISYAQRIDLLIGKGELPVIWTFRLDVLKV